MNYLFDVDGTLTPSRLPIDKDFEQFFLKWMKDKDVYLVTGSDKEKTIEQIGINIWENVNKVYQSCGNQIWQKGQLIRESSFSLNDNVKHELQNFLKGKGIPCMIYYPVPLHTQEAYKTEDMMGSIRKKYKR